MTTRDDARATACGIVLDRLRSDDYGCDVNAGTHSRICDDIAAALDAARAEGQRIAGYIIFNDPGNAADWNNCCQAAIDAVIRDSRDRELLQDTKDAMGRDPARGEEER